MNQWQQYQYQKLLILETLNYIQLSYIYWLIIVVSKSSNSLLFKLNVGYFYFYINYVMIKYIFLLSALIIIFFRKMTAKSHDPIQWCISLLQLFIIYLPFVNTVMVRFGRNIQWLFYQILNQLFLINNFEYLLD